jgi:signal transduction histidine kinase/DNA-binding NarL/FixJ family response regulator
VREGVGIRIAAIRAAWATVRGRLFGKYVALLAALVCAVLAANGAIWITLSYHDQRASFVRIQREQATGAATKIGQFISEIEAQLGWMTQLPSAAVTVDQQRFDALRLLRQVPAVTELTLLDDAGREQLRVSRMELDVVGSGIDRSNEPVFLEAKARKPFYGPVYLHRGSEPYMTMAQAGPRGDSGVSVAKVNLKLIWDVVSRIKVGAAGEAYVVDASGRLVGHPDISLVLRNTDFSGLAQVRAALKGAADAPATAKNIFGQPVLAAYAAIAPLGWWVFVEVPVAEAFAPLYSTLLATGIVLLGGLTLAVLASLFLARKLVTPIQALETGAAHIGAGGLDHRIKIETGDELQALGDQFNRMASRLQDSYATLERKVEERTHQLQLANLAKSRFLAAASHDLRQPLHALNLFSDQLRADPGDAKRGRLVAQIRSSVAAMNELFNALLDISKLDAGHLEPNVAEFPIAPLLERIGATVQALARKKGLRLRVLPTGAWVRSDPILLERILLNLASNAVKYTEAGGVIIGCRRRGESLRIEVVDSGIGIPEDQQQAIFGEFVQLAGSQGAGAGGLGLGLAIVERLAGLLDHPIEVKSRINRGSRFSLAVPSAVAREEAVPPAIQVASATDPVSGKLLVVIDNDPKIRDGMHGLLTSWGCEVVAAASPDEALDSLARSAQAPDLIIADYHLSGGKNGLEVIDELRKSLAAPIPAFLVSGDTSPDRLREVNARGHYLLHKPILPVTLRATVNQLLRGVAGNGSVRQEALISSHRPEAASNSAPRSQELPPYGWSP